MKGAGLLAGSTSDDPLGANKRAFFNPATVTPHENRDIYENTKFVMLLIESLHRPH
jgi:hypothetical protein